MVRRWNFDSKLLTIREMHMQNLYARVWNKIFALYNVLKSHLSHNWMRRSFAERKDAHTDTKNMWDMSSCFWDKFTERAEIGAFFLTSFALAGVKIFHLHENWLCRCTAHHDGERHGARIKSISPKVLDLRSQKKSLILLLLLMMTSASKKILRIKKGT